MERDGDAGRVTVRTLGVGDLDAIADVMARSFAEESLFSRLLGGDVDRRVRQLRPLLRAMVKGHMRCSEVDGAFVGERLAGVAVTIRPERFPVKAGDMLYLAMVAMPAVLRVGLSSPGLFKLFAAAKQFEANHPRDEPCWYLGWFAVDPDLRRAGVARDLARVVLDRADAQQIGCYLDTAGERTMRMCRFLGFRVRHELKPFPDGPTCWGMWRAPRPLGAHG